MLRFSSSTTSSTMLEGCPRLVTIRMGLNPLRLLGDTASSVGNEEYAALGGLMLDKNISKLSRALYRIVEHQMLPSFKEFKGDCHKYFKRYNNPEQTRANPPHKLVGEQSRTNKATREKQPCNHSSGCKSLLQRQHELTEKRGQPIDHMKLFMETHARSDQLVLQTTEDAHSQPTVEGFQPLSRDEICEKVLGRRPSYLKGLSWGLKPKCRKSCDIEIAHITKGINEEDDRRNESDTEGTMSPCGVESDAPSLTLDRKHCEEGFRRCVGKYLFPMPKEDSGNALFPMYRRHVGDHVCSTLYQHRPQRRQEKCILVVVLVARRE
ncbi:CACTA en-spm transposon protein [Cucumis melo var. makuwa]|uniref:CACTA en-spm transposon protein n=1 Tax=Cucumis melo var. makuwa TaxID=1194695 RepID=A0A5A7TBH6_CUCMM|nr:CACTA en-spm transposon protein [Cucumis melo var. makuwa]